MRLVILLLLTRDGALHRRGDDGKAAVVASYAKARALAELAGGRTAVVVGDRLRVGARAVPGRFGEVTALAARGDELAALTDKRELVAIDLATGARRPLTTVKLRGPPIAFAFDGGKIYFATHTGQLWELDEKSGAQRELGLGSWWGALAMAAWQGKLYVATQSGKLWEIDPSPSAPSKTALDLGGWEATIALAVSR